MSPVKGFFACKRGLLFKFTSRTKSRLSQGAKVWKIFFDREVDKWVVSEYSRANEDEGEFTFVFRHLAAASCARRNGITSAIPFWSEGEGDAYE